MLAHPVTVAPELDDVAIVQQPVDEGRGTSPSRTTLNGLCCGHCAAVGLRQDAVHGFQVAGYLEVRQQLSHPVAPVACLSPHDTEVVPENPTG